VGPNHQAGSDSLLTLHAYLALRHILGHPLFEQHLNLIYGIPTSPPKPASQPSLQATSYPPNAHQKGPLYQYLQQSQQRWSPDQTYQNTGWFGFGFGRR
jgi:hypothetical protein